jgi:hypothetical protein
MPPSVSPVHLTTKAETIGPGPSAQVPGADAFAAVHRARMGTLAARRRPPATARSGDRPTG